MSLFSTVQQAANALKVSELGLHVAGNNIANANTPGYIRQELVQAPAAGLRFGDVILGYGVRAVGVVQKLDEFTLERLRQTESDLASSEAQSEIYDQLESLFGELTDTDLSSQLSEFSSAVQDVLNQPGNDALRRLVIERGKSISTNVRTLGQRFSEISANLNQEVRNTVTEINRITEQVATLNRRIVEIEGGKTSGSDAVGLRDERLMKLQELSRLVNVKTVEQESGAITVFVGGEYLVAEGIQREVTTALRQEDGGSVPEIRLKDTDSPLRVTSGRLHGIYAARESTIGDSAAAIDTFAADLVEQFNRIHSQGQGIEGFQELTGTNATDDRLGPLDLAGLPLEIENGSFEIQVLDLETQITKTHTVRIKLTGGTDDTSLEDVRAAVESISGLSATLTPEGQFRLSTDSNQLRFSFQNDSAGFLAAAGLNTFFVGNSAATIDVNPMLSENPNMLAASLSGVGSGTENALRLAEAFDQPLDGLGGRSIKERYEDIVVRTTQDINVQKGVSDGLRNFYRTLEAEHLAASGVNLDEEAVKMIFYQRAFQASSRLIQASSEMLDTLVNL